MNLKKTINKLVETKAAPKGFHFTSDGKLKRGDADSDGPGGKMLRADPLDKQRSKVPPVSEAVSVNKKSYSWGKMITVHQGRDTSYPLHPEHQAKIKALKPGEKTTFTDETNKTVHAEREGDKVHLSSKGTSKKTTVAHSHFLEQTEMVEKTLTSAEKKKREEVAKAIERDQPGMPMAKKMAIATATAKKVAEEYEDPEMEKKEMAKTQAHFIKYAAEEILEYFDMGGKIEEWYQNKLSKVHSDMEGLHSWVEGYKRKSGMVESEQIDELKRRTLASYTRKAADQMAHASIEKSTGAAMGAMGRMSDMPDVAKKGEEREGKAFSQILKRTKGIAAASRRLAREEVELGESRTRADIEKEIEHHTKQIEAISNSSPGNHPQATLNRRRMARPHVKKKEALEKELANLKEEIEKLDELKLSTLTRYGTKAMQAYGRNPEKDDKRLQGIQRARAKVQQKTMKKEEVELEERVIVDREMNVVQPSHGMVSQHKEQIHSALKPTNKPRKLEYHSSSGGIKGDHTYKETIHNDPNRKDPMHRYHTVNGATGKVTSSYSAPVKTNQSLMKSKPSVSNEEVEMDEAIEDRIYDKGHSPERLQKTIDKASEHEKSYFKKKAASFFKPSKPEDSYRDHLEGKRLNKVRKVMHAAKTAQSIAKGENPFANAFTASLAGRPSGRR